MVALWILIGVAAVATVVGLGWLLHRLCIRLEEAGYLYYREKGGGAAAGVLNEFDRLVRPSVEHTIQAEEHVRDEEEIDGD